MEKRFARATMVKAGGAAAASAALANSLIYAIGSSAGADFTLSSGANTTTVGLAQVIAVSALAVLAGALAAMTVGARRFRWLEMAAAVFTFGSLGGPLSMGVGTAAKLSLAAMHLVAFASWVLWLRWAAVGARGGRDGAASQTAVA